jgi:hypothetical protein
MVIRTLGFPAMLTRLFGFSSGILVLVLLPMWYDCFNGCVRARSLGTATQIKKRENHCWYLQVYGLISVPLSFGWLQENTRLCHGRRKV